MSPKDKFEILIKQNRWLQLLSRFRDSKYVEEYQYLLDRTQFLPEDSTISQRAWHLVYGIIDIPKCLACGGETSYKSYVTGYRNYCSNKCVGNPQVVEKRKLTSIKNWGTDNPSKSDEVKSKIKSTFMERYDGATGTAAVPEFKEQIRQTNLQKYGVGSSFEAEEVKEKIRKTNIKRLGVEYPMQSKDVLEKSKKTNLANRGVEYPTQCPEVMGKIAATNLERYGHINHLCTEESKERLKQLSLDRFGTEYPVQSEEIKAKIRATNVEKYGTECVLSLPETHAKSKDTIKERYGEEFDYISQVPEVKERTKETNLVRYGFEHPASSPIVRERILRSIKDKYGDEYVHIFQVPEIKNKTKETNLKNYNRRHHLQASISLDSLDKLNEYDWMYEKHITEKRTLLEISDILEVSPSTVRNYMIGKHNIEIQNYNRSYQEERLFSFLKEAGYNVVANDRTKISPYELDIFLPDYNVAIEYCGLYWHSEEKKSKDYHREKFECCEKNNINVLHIFEDEWLEREELVKARIISIVESTVVKKESKLTHNIVRLDESTASTFFNEFHLEGSGNGTISYGLFDENDIIAAISFVQEDGEYTLSRYVSKSHDVDHFEILLKHFELEFNKPVIKIVQDLRWGNGNYYKKFGFNVCGELPISFYWTKGVNRMDEVIENELTSNHYRIWDCGKRVFIKNNNMLT